MTSPTNQTPTLDEVFDKCNGSGAHACYCPRSTDGGCKCAIKDEYLTEVKQAIADALEEIIGEDRHPAREASGLEKLLDKSSRRLEWQNELRAEQRQRAALFLNDKSKENT